MRGISGAYKRFSGRITQAATRAAWVAVLLCAAHAALRAQQPSGARVSATVDSTRILIGEQFHLLLEASSAGPARWAWAEVPDSFDHLMVVNRGRIDTLQQAGKTVYRQSITLTGFDSGYWQIPSFRFQTVTGDTTAGAGVMNTDSLSIMVNTVPVDTTKPFRPIKQIRSVPLDLLAYWPYALGFVVLLLVILWFVFFRKHTERVVRAPEAPAEPPYDEAVRSLKALETEKLWQQHQVKSYYTKLTDILRRYIERQFGVNAMEQTSDELLANIRPVTKLNQQRDNLRYILETADLAKFAKLEPQQDAHEASLKKAYEMIEWTRPRQETPGGAREKETKTTT